MATLPVRRRNEVLYTMVDDEDAARIGQHRLSLASHGYVQIAPDSGKPNVLLHRWLMGAQPHDGRIVDHINRDRLDNRRSNLRFVNPSESSSNVSAHGISGYRGVYPNRKRWAAKGKKSGRRYHLGTYDSPEEAAAVAHAWRLENLPGYVGET